MDLEWDVRQPATNYRKHGVYFSESLPVFDDNYAVTIIDEDADPCEQRFVSVGTGAKGKVLERFHF